MTRQGAICRISFSAERAQKKIKWQQSTRLTPGSVLAISTAEDNFKTVCMIATVAARYVKGGLEPNLDHGEPETMPPRVEISWADAANLVMDPHTELVIIEATSGFFESVRHAMVGLQNWDSYE